MKAAFEGYSFRLSENVARAEVCFRDRYGIELVGDLYVPKGAKDRLAVIAMCGPFGAVKGQASGLYADEMTSGGFAALAFDPFFIRESGEEARNVASLDINTEDSSAAVDVLFNMDMVGPERIGAIGICGFGGMALDAVAMDTRIEAAVTPTMYDIARANAKSYFDQDDSAQTRYKMEKTLNAQRTEDFKSGTFTRVGGVVDPLPDDAPFFAKDYYNYYEAGRGYTERSLNSNEGWNKTSSLFFINMPILQYSEEIHNAVLMIHSERAHSCYFSRDAFSKLTGGSREPLILPDTVHIDLYDGKDKIPFHKIESSFTESLYQGRSQ